MHLTLHTLVFVAAMSVTFAAVAISDSKPSAVCGQIEKSCSKPEECCSGCCQNNKCSNCNHSPCSFHHCPHGKECYLHKVTCVAAPCNPIPACRPIDSDYDTE
ncbi:uncharacterized protein LOC142321814 [Lycorma delicatula]|uniref:uncharacterized protein LOC142321814 n=1 Tax=Lycorma delicatula TaxID=130591 RepID=UPI003F5105F4